MGKKDNDKNISGITDLLETRDIKSMIYTIRGQQVMLDSDCTDTLLNPLTSRLGIIWSDSRLILDFNYQGKS